MTSISISYPELRATLDFVESEIPSAQLGTIRLVFVSDSPVFSHLVYNPWQAEHSQPEKGVSGNATEREE